jgi:hypothetical protein
VSAPFDRLERGIRRLGRHAAGLQQSAIDIAGELAAVRRVLHADATGRLELALQYALLRESRARRRASSETSATGAWKLETRPQSRGAMAVRIDEGKWFRLSRSDGRLFRLLASASRDRDGFPAWQTYEQIADRIMEKTGVRPTRHALVQAVHRIRKALRQADLNEFLLRVDRKRGRLRFLLRPSSQ